MEEKKTGLAQGITLRPYQNEKKEEVLEKLLSGEKKNFFIALPQGAGKTITTLSVLSELINTGKAENVLVILPRTVLVDQWVEGAQEKFYGLTIMKNPTISKKSIRYIRGWMRHSGAKGIAMTMHSFRNFIKRGDFSEDDFDMVIVDEAMDIVARDFIEQYRMSYYHMGLEKWQTPKIFLFPFQVKESRLDRMVKKFGVKVSCLIREDIRDASTKMVYSVPNPIIIDDPLVNSVTSVLEEEYRQARRNVMMILNKYHIEGYKENLETLLSHRVIKRLRERYAVDNNAVQQIQTMISKYILTRHIKKWFLYSNRSDISRSILASQIDVEEWLKHEDKKLLKLVEVVQSIIKQNKKIYIFSQYVATAELIHHTLQSKLGMGQKDVTIVTGEDQEEQYLKLEQFKKEGHVLISTPVFDKGTDIPQADAIIVYTPPLSKDSLFQVVGRIRGGDVVFLAYQGYEEEIINAISESLREGLKTEDNI